MLLKVSKLSKWDKKHWIFKYSNSDFDEIINLIINNLDYDYIELLIWSAELYLFNDIDYILLNDNRKFSTIKIDKSNSIKILEPSIYDEIRHFEIKIFRHSTPPCISDSSSNSLQRYLIPHRPLWFPIPHLLET